MLHGLRKLKEQVRCKRKKIYEGVKTVKNFNKNRQHNILNKKLCTKKIFRKDIRWQKIYH